MNIIEKANSQGFNCVDDNGVIVLLVPRDDYLNPVKFRKISKGFKSFLGSQEYHSSYGYRAVDEANNNN